MVERFSMALFSLACLIAFALPFYLLFHLGFDMNEMEMAIGSAVIFPFIAIPYNLFKKYNGKTFKEFFNSRTSEYIVVPAIIFTGTSLTIIYALIPIHFIFLMIGAFLSIVYWMIFKND